MTTQTEIEKFVTEAKRGIDADPQMREAMTRKTIINDFCRLLGWEFPPARVEYTVEAFGNKKVDYAYVHEGSERAFIEAKALHKPLREKHTDELKDYLRNANAKLGILTNGKEYQFYRRVKFPEFKVKQVKILNLQELPDDPRVLKQFTPDNLSEQGYNGIDMFQERLQERKLHETLQAKKREIAAEIERTIVEQTEKKIPGGKFSQNIQSQIDTAAKSAVDTLASRVEPNSSDEGDDQEIDQKRNNGDEKNGENEDSYLIKIKSSGSALKIFSGDTQTDAMAEAVNYLIENHGLGPKLEPLPYIPGREKAIVNDQPTSPHDEKAMRNYRELSEGYYLDTHMSGRGKKKYINKFANKCQLTVTFSGEW